MRRSSTNTIWSMCCAFSPHTDHGCQSAAALATYSSFVAELFDREHVQHCTIAVWSDSPYTGTAEGEVRFARGLRLRVREELDFAATLITSYGHEVYRGDQRLFWPDDFPHPNDPALAVTFPHRKHVRPDIKRHRVPGPGLSLARPNLPLLLQEIAEFASAHPE